MNFWFAPIVLLMSFLAAGVVPQSRSTADELTIRHVDFNRDIRAVLSDKCFLCHGPDEKNREADLRLDIRADAIQSGVIAPGDVDASEILARIASNDPDTVMPPPSTGKKITPDEAEKLRQWVAAGADYDEHWAFIPPRRPELPQVNNSNWCKTPIDFFVLAKLDEKKLQPSPTAEPETLVRRLYLDLVGLPPAPQDIDRWKGKHQETAKYLLQSPHFGERWARWWLDAARYSDSDGYEKDKQREVWFYRDWVIDSLNRDLPYDDFVIKQIAGDLLPRATQSDRVATGFLRNSMVNEEGGADPEQFRIEGMFDRMDAIGKSILGITTQCAQCHSHKYDPLGQDEYYQMLAALNDFHEAILTVYAPDEETRRKSLLEQMDALENELRISNPQWQQQLQQWQSTTVAKQAEWTTAIPQELPFEGQKFRLLGDGSVISESYAPTRMDNWFPCNIEPGAITAVRLDALTHPQLPHGGPGRSIYGTGALSEFEVTIAPQSDPSKKTTLKIARAIADVNPAESTLPTVFREQDPKKDDRVTGGIEMAIDGDHKTAWSTDIGPGRRNQNRHAVFVLESPLQVSEPSVLSFRLVQKHGGWNSDDNQNYLIGRYRFSTTDHTDPAAGFIPSELEPIISRPAEEFTEGEQRKLFSYWRTTIDKFAVANQAIEALWQQHPSGASQLAVEKLDKPRETFVMVRGDFLKPGDRVTPGTPSFLNPLPDNNEPARLRLARWLVDDRSPTTARVIVNRIWQTYFGRGIVTTPEDFGRQSPPPTHPELLDWLAVELMENNWSLKHIHELIVNSAVYQQSSKANPEQIAADRYNEWLARGPRFRVEAEVVRDIALSVSGLLRDTLGGPSVYPPAPDFLFQPPASYGPKIWNTDSDADQYRRSLYVHSYRSVPYPPLQVFDAPKGDAACIRRQHSNTPLQALVVLNEPQFVDCARAMATRVIRESPQADDVSRIHHAYRLATGRVPSNSEIQILIELLQKQRTRITAGEISFEELLGVSGSLVQQLTGVSASETVPWVVLSRTLLNLDETITKD